MNRDADQLEHLFSREIDGEATAEDRELLASLVRDDARLQAMLDDYRTLDQVAGQALRQAMGRAPRVSRLHPVRRQLGRAALIAVAAGLMLAMWLRPMPRLATSPTQRVQQAGMLPVPSASWFAPPVVQGDQVVPVPLAYERPEVRVRGTQREWIVMPGRTPGRVYIIEVNRVRTHAVTVHQDF